MSSFSLLFFAKSVCSLLARVHFHGPSAFFTFHVAAPVKLTTASFHHGLNVRVVPATTAEQFAPVDRLRRSVAFASVRAHRADSEILLAEIR